MHQREALTMDPEGYAHRYTKDGRIVVASPSGDCTEQLHSAIGYMVATPQEALGHMDWTPGRGKVVWGPLKRNLLLHKAQERGCTFEEALEIDFVRYPQDELDLT